MLPSVTKFKKSPSLPTRRFPARGPGWPARPRRAQKWNCGGTRARTRRIDALVGHTAREPSRADARPRFFRISSATSPRRRCIFKPSRFLKNAYCLLPTAQICDDFGAFANSVNAVISKNIPDPSRYRDRNGRAEWSETTGNNVGLVIEPDSPLTGRPNSWDDVVKGRTERWRNKIGMNAQLPRCQVFIRTGLDSPSARPSQKAAIWFLATFLAIMLAEDWHAEAPRPTVNRK